MADAGLNPYPRFSTWAAQGASRAGEGPDLVPKAWLCGSRFGPQSM